MGENCKLNDEIKLHTTVKPSIFCNIICCQSQAIANIGVMAVQQLCHAGGGSGGMTKMTDDTDTVG